MATLAHRYAEMKKKLGGSREQTKYEHTTGFTLGENVGITELNPPMRRITGQMEFALQLNEVQKGRFTADIDRALTLLEQAVETEGTLTRNTCLEAEQALLPLAEAAKEYTILLVGHAHIDMNWMWTWNETVATTLATFRTMLDIMDEYPDFHFSQSQASVYKIVEDYDPSMMERIKARIAEGRWEITASAWVETDKNMPSTESLLRHIQCTKTYLRDTWGVDPASLEIDFSPDTFGHSANLPEIDAQGDVKYYYHCRALSDRDLVLYRWKGLSGKEMLCYREPHWYNSSLTARLGAYAVDIAETCGGLKTCLAVYGVGDHGGGPTRRDLERARDMMQWPVFPRMKFSTLRDFFHAAETVWDSLPVVDHELNGVFRGCYTTQSRIKMGNRACERSLIAAEGINALAAAKVGAPVRAEKYQEAWRNTLFTHFHDILTGSCTPDSREYAMGLYANVLATSQTQLEQAARAIIQQIDTTSIVFDDPDPDSLSEGAGAGYGGGFASDLPRSEHSSGATRVFHVFNPTAIPKNEAVEITVWDWMQDMQRARFTDADGTPLPFDVCDNNQQSYWNHRYFRALVKVAVAPFGYTTVVLHEEERGSKPPVFLFENNGWIDGEYTDRVLENEYLRAVFSNHDGRLISLWDKEHNRECLRDGDAGGLCLIDTERGGYEAWRIGRHRAVHPITDCRHVEGGSNQTLQQRFTVAYRMRSSSAQITVSLRTGERALRYQVDLDWHEITQGDTIPVLAYRLPLAEAPDTYLYDVPAGWLARKPFNNDMPSLQYAVANDPLGTGAGIVTSSKYGYRGCKDGTLFATFLNSSSHPDPYPEFGKHTISFHVGVFATDPKVLEDTATSLNNPLVYLPGTGSHTGCLPLSAEFLHFDSSSCVISSLTAIEGGFRVRLYNTGNTASVCTLALDRPFTGAALLDVLDNERTTLAVNNGTLSWEVPAFAVQSVLLKV